MSLRVLIADKNPNSLRILVKAFEKKGFDVFESSSGEGTLKLLHINNVPHLVILNSILEGLSTPELCQAIRKETRLSKVPIMILEEKKEDPKPYQGLHIRSFVSKTTPPDEIVKKAEALTNSSTNIQSAPQQTSVLKIIGFVLIIGICLLFLIMAILIPLFSHK